MALDNFSIKFTDDTYASKQEIKSILHTSLIYRIYEDVLDYRKANCKYLPLYTIDSRGFYITTTTVLKDIYAGFETSLNSLCTTYFAQKLNSSNAITMKNLNLVECLLSANSVCGFNINELTIKAIVSGAYRENNPAHYPLIQYKKALEWIEENYINQVDESLLGKLYEILSNTSELTEFFRVSEVVNRNTTALIGNKLNKAPVRMIEGMMEAFYKFVNDTDIRPSVRALVAMYYINYVKPFVNYNELMAMLVAKYILAHDQMSTLAATFNLEQVLVKTPRLDDYLKEMDEEGDVTFIVTYGIGLLKPYIKTYLDNLVRIRNAAIREENFVLDEVDSRKDEVEENEVSIDEKEYVTPEVKQPKVNVSPTRPAEKVAVTPSARVSSINVATGGLAISPKVEQMSEKEIKDTAKYLLEINPNLRKMQAYFFASHCLIGRYYSIQDYKKYAKCAYETARTSMDNLAKQGFYDKIAVKNKFVYTPIKQGEEK